MKFFGITGVANRLMEYYLRNRYQRLYKMVIIIQMIVFLSGKKYSMESHRVPFLDHCCF